MLLSDSFVRPFFEKKPDWGQVGEFTWRRTYERDLDLGHWAGTSRRVSEWTHQSLKSYCIKNNRPWSEDKARASAEKMFKLMFDFKFLPPGRGLWVAGTKVPELKGGAALNNCGFVSTGYTVIDAATWLMDMSMLGVGVGFDLLGADTTTGSAEGPLGRLIKAKAGRVHVIDDTREGWVSAVYAALIGYTNFDYSKIRPVGSPIETFGGTASGPEPLRELINWIIANVHPAEYWSKTLIVDLMNMIGRTVVAGNVRRSAEIALGDASDEFLNLKNYEMYPEETAMYRWASNNSVVASVGDDYSGIAERIAANGEPGVFWLDNARRFGRMGRSPDNADLAAAGCNPCSEQTLEHKELCCLVETFPSRHESFYEYQETLKYAYLYAKAVTLIETHDADTNEIIRRNRRIGCSMSGIQEAVAKFGTVEFYRKWCREGYKYIKSLDSRYSEWLDVNRSIKVTSVKPSGTVSLLPGVSPGIHFPISEYYYRVIRVRSDSPFVEMHKKAGYRCVDLSPKEPDTTAIYFPVKQGNFSRAEHEVSLWEQFEHVRMMQHQWADNQVSATLKFHKHEEKDIEPLLEMAQFSCKSLSMLPHSEHGFEHAPYQPITRYVYTKAIDALSEVDYSEAKHEVTDAYCDGDACTVPAGDNE